MRDQHGTLHVAHGTGSYRSPSCGFGMYSVQHLWQSAPGSWTHEVISADYNDDGSIVLTEDVAGDRVTAIYTTRPGWGGWVEHAEWNRNDVEFDIAQTSMTTPNGNVRLDLSAVSPSGQAIDELFFDVSGTCDNAGSVFVRDRTLWSGGPLSLGPTAVGGSFRVDIGRRRSWHLLRVGAKHQGRVLASDLVWVQGL